MSMVPVYTADSALDAQLVQDLLVGAGIAAQVHGPNVADLRTGAPPGRGFRVVVEEAEVATAQELIDDWQSPAPDDEEFDLLDSFPMPREA
jgi:hypothetical protein